MAAPNSQRNTMQKSIVLNTVRRMCNHPSADMVYEQVHGEYPTVSKATVYRVLNQLAARGDIRKISVSNGADCYDHNISLHYHIRCSVCGSVGDVMMDEIPQLSHPEQYITDCGGYVVTGSSALFEGICPRCAAASEKIV